MRYEHKFEFINGYENALGVYLLKKGFKEIFKKRLINSLYYDDNRFNLYSESENGISERTKIRARYYDKGTEGFRLEKKIKKEDTNTKEISTKNISEAGKLLPLKFQFNPKINTDIKLPESINKVYTPKSIVSYERRYYLSPDKNRRATIDMHINFYHAQSNNNNILINRFRSLNHGILEIKNEFINSNYSKLYQEISSEFNLILGRSSKYCKSIQSLYFT